VAKSPDIIHGQIFQSDLHAAFKDLDKRFPVRWGRVIDSAGAGNLIKKADADFKFQLRAPEVGRPFYLTIEAKATVMDKKFNTYFRSLVKPHQNGAMIMQMRAGAQGCYIVRFVNRKEIELWDAWLIGAYYPLLRKPIVGEPALIIKDDELQSFAVRCCDPVFLQGLLGRLASTRQGLTTNILPELP
jgi:hypothetical protein